MVSVLGGGRRAKRRWPPLKYSPTAHICAGTPIDHSPTAEIIKGNGELLPVSKMPCDGVFPPATTKYEKRDLALNIPSWNPDACVQSGKCAVSRRRLVITSRRRRE
ncbi:hypothetical protein [Fibrobacter sp.]|uniref:hypothetical protein n=1 Tax=Fibrobacter sp. TaxID=35828 RepID=UPI0025C158D2|nr:hypothetical protein [Fibrobacter sp.]MCI6438417.1 hypothetical protein [Fibrobacter sp.]